MRRRCNQVSCLMLRYTGRSRAHGGGLCSGRHSVMVQSHPACISVSMQTLPAAWWSHVPNKLADHVRDVVPDIHPSPGSTDTPLNTDTRWQICADLTMLRPC